MNRLNSSNAAQLNATTAPTSVSDATLIFPKGTVFTVIGQVHNWQLGFAGRIQCTLRLSVGDLPIVANRDTLSLDIGDGAWVRARLLHRHTDGAPFVVLSAVAAQAAPGQACWVPVSLYHRIDAMHELRRLLSLLEPALQGVFISVMLDSQVQRRFFMRPAAADHDCYPGGLFDQSVSAANLAHRAEYANAHDRGLATMASLLFDIGKANDLQLRADRSRTWPELNPHPATAQRLKRTFERLGPTQAPLVQELADLLAGRDAPRVHVTPRMAALRAQVRQAVHTSWGPVDSFLTLTTPGAHA